MVAVRLGCFDLGMLPIWAGAAAAALNFCPSRSDAHSPHDHIEAFEMAVSTEDPGRMVMLIVVRGNLWRSLDGGSNWKRIVRGLDNRKALARLAVEKSDGALTWYLSTEGDHTVFRSDDDGWSWRRLADGTPVPGKDEPLTFGPAGKSLVGKRITSVLKRDESRWFVSTWNDGVFFSGDGGRHWERRADGLTTDPQGDRRGLPQFTTLRGDSAGALYLAGYDGLFRSDNEGRAWTEIETLPETLLIDFAISPVYHEDGELVATTYWKGVFHSSDRGDTWRPLNGNVAPSNWDHLRRKLKGDDEYAQVARFHSIAFSPDYASDRTLFAGLRNWFLSLDHTGDRWERVELTQFAEGEDVIPDRMAFSDAFAEDGTLFFCSRLGEGKTRRGGVFKSTDRGRTFALVHQAEGKYLQSLAISPGFSGDGTILVSSARGGNNSDVFRSTDHGTTWEIVTGDLEFVDFGAELAISPDYANDRTLWAGTERGLWRSTDGGDTWTRLVAEGLPADGFVDMIAVSPGFAEDRLLVVTIKGEGTFVSRNDQKSFVPFYPELFEGNHQFNRLWSYSPGNLVKFASPHSDIFGMTGEELIRIGEAGPRFPPIRPVAAAQGEVGTAGFWTAAAVVLAGCFSAVWISVRRMKRKRSG